MTTNNKSTEVEYIWFATDGQGNNMGTFVLESDARQFAMKYGYTVGWWIKDKEKEILSDGEVLDLIYEYCESNVKKHPILKEIQTILKENEE